MEGAGKGEGEETARRTAILVPQIDGGAIFETATHDAHGGKRWPQTGSRGRRAQKTKRAREWSDGGRRDGTYADADGDADGDVPSGQRRYSGFGVVGVEQCMYVYKVLLYACGIDHLRLEGDGQMWLSQLVRAAELTLEPWGQAAAR